MTVRSPLVYVAGPMTSDPYGCVRQATGAYRILRAAGCTPFLPQLSVLHEMVDPMPYEEWLAYDFEIIAHCDALIRLPGDSPGADAEVAHAELLGLPVFHLDGAAGRQTEIATWVARRNVGARQISALFNESHRTAERTAPEPIDHCSLCGGNACEYSCGPRTGCRHKHDGPDSHRVCGRCKGSGRNEPTNPEGPRS